MTEGNALGGKSASGLYVPMSEDEVEASYRAAERGIVVVVDGWGTFPAEGFHVGEHRVGVEFSLTCPPGSLVGRIAADLPIRVQTTDGIVLFTCTTSAGHGGRPVCLQPNQVLGLNLEIEVHHCDPDVVRQLKSSATGLTSRRVDPQTGRWDGAGNMRLGEQGMRALHDLNESHRVRDQRTSRG